VQAITLAKITPGRLRYRFLDLLIHLLLLFMRSLQNANGNTGSVIMNYFKMIPVSSTIVLK